MSALPMCDVSSLYGGAQRLLFLPLESLPAQSVKCAQCCLDEHKSIAGAMRRVHRVLCASLPCKSYDIPAEHRQITGHSKQKLMILKSHLHLQLSACCQSVLYLAPCCPICPCLPRHRLLMSPHPAWRPHLAQQHHSQGHLREDQEGPVKWMAAPCGTHAAVGHAGAPRVARSAGLASVTTPPEPCMAEHRS